MARLIPFSMTIMIVSILATCFYPNTISALSPSHPNATWALGHPFLPQQTNMESPRTTPVQSHMRRRLSDTTSPSYRPKHLSSRYCRYIDDEKCRYYDEMLGEARHNRLLERQQPKEERPVGPVGEYHRAIQSIKSPQLSSSYTLLSNEEEEHHRKLEQQHYEKQVSYHKEILRNRLANYTKPRRLAPSVGDNIRVLVLLTRFKGHENRVLPNRDYFDTLLNGDGVSDINPVGSVKEWFRYSSLANYRVVFDVRDWTMASGTESDFAKGTSGNNGPEFQQTIATSTLTTLDNSNSVDWLDGYVDEFGYLNQLVVLHSGYAAEGGDLPCSSIESERSALNRIWSQGSSEIGLNGWKSKDMYQLNSYAVTSALDFTQCNSDNILTTNPATMGQIVHEYNHGFGLPDLYDQDGDESTAVMYGGVSNFGVMANPWGWKYNGKANGHHDPWCRIENEWVVPIEITENGFYSIMASEVSGQVFKIQGSYPAGEYILIENRQPLKWDKDMDSIDSTGIVIYHIDQNTDGQTTRGYPGHPNWPIDHYMVSVLQADGLYDIEKGVNDGDTGDFWKKGQILGPGPTNPNTNSILFGIDTVTNIKITITSDPSFIMTFQVEGLPTVTRSTPKTGGDPQSTRSTIQWLIGTLMGAAALLGLVVLFMAI